MTEKTSETAAEARDFIRDQIRSDLASGKVQAIQTRFPPEPNGYLHIGHAKSICLNFGLAEHFKGGCHLRDVRWLGFDWNDNLFFASDYFEQLYAWAEHLIENGHAYIDHQTADQIRETRGTLTEPGTASPYRDRNSAENLDLFRRMRAGEFAEGTCVLRAKIDMASGNINLRDPVLYRILKKAHPRTGDTWCIYPNYDFAHGQSDAIEHVTHSLCTLEFSDHRPLYDWFIAHLPVPATPKQYEFSRLNLTHTVLSKRRLNELVTGGHVAGWDDPRMPTIAGLRRRGFPAAAIRDFISRIAITKTGDSTVEMAMLEFCVRNLLNKSAERRMAVLNPIKVVIENYPEGETEYLDAVNNPEDEAAGVRQVPFSRELYIEREDFMIDPPKKFFRLGPGREVRLRWAYFLTCQDYVTDDEGNVIELRCTYDPETRGGDAPDGRKVKATLHWVSAPQAVPAEVRIYDYLFSRPDPGAEGDWLDDINPESLTVIESAMLEPTLLDFNGEDPVQFERQGYFVRDAENTADGRPVFSRTIGLRDAWAKAKAKG